MEKCLLDLLEKERHVVKECNFLLDDIEFCKNISNQSVLALEKLNQYEIRLNLLKSELFYIREEIKAYFK